MLKRTLRVFAYLLLALVFGVAVLYRLDLTFNINIEPFHSMIRDFSSLFRLGFSILLFFTGVGVFLKNEDPASTISWLIVFISFPVTGFFLYLMIGRSFKKERLAKIKKSLKLPDEYGHRMQLTEEILRHQEKKEDQGLFTKVVKLLQKNSDSPLCVNNNSKFYFEGVELFDDIVKDIKNAEISVHVEYYIIKDDETGRKFKELLCEKQRNGIKVRLLYDDVGCLNLENDFFNDLKEAGGEVYPFLPVMFPSFSRSLNYRNHRKIIVIDSSIAYIGGMNMADEYRGRGSQFSYWRDTHMRIVGDSVREIDRCFVHDWIFTSKKHIKDNPKYEVDKVKEIKPMQIIASGPDTEWESIMQAFLLMVSTANKSIKITSPYFVPNQTLLDAIKVAALSGIDVEIMIPDKPDHFFVFWATRANLKQLLEAGVKIYQYRKGFIHAKTLCIDGKYSSVGTANFDYRSLKINFEINAFIYDEKTTSELEAQFEADKTDSAQLTLKRHLRRPFREIVLEAVGHLVSPLQ